MIKCYSWGKNSAKTLKIAFWEMSKRHFWGTKYGIKKWFGFFSRNDAYSIPEIRFFQKSH